MLAQRKPTRRQQQILDFIREATVEHGFPPSIREIGDAVGLLSSSTVQSHLKTLEKKGWLKRELNKPRSIQLIAPPTPRKMHLKTARRLAAALQKHRCIESTTEALEVATTTLAVELNRGVA